MTIKEFLEELDEEDLQSEKELICKDEWGTSQEVYDIDVTDNEIILHFL